MTHIQVVRKPNEPFLREVSRMVCEGREVTLRARGVSMRPFLEDERDMIVLVRPDNIKVGDPVLAEIAPGRYVFHRIVQIEGDRVTLRGDGNPSSTEHCTLADIAASAIAFIRKGRRQSIDGRAWRWYSALWPSNAVARRVLLAIYRRLPSKWR